MTERKSFVDMSVAMVRNIQPQIILRDQSTEGIGWTMRRNAEGSC